MDQTPDNAVRTDWDKLISLFASKLDEAEWEKILMQTESVSVSVEGVPDDTLRILVSLFGEERGVQWLYHDRTYRNEPVIEFLRSYPDRSLAIKAVDHRVYTLYRRNLNDSFKNTLKENYRNWSWDTFICDLEKQGYYHECDEHIDGVDQSIVNLVYSSILPEKAKRAFFTTPIYELHGKTPVELSESDEGRYALKLYIQYLGALKNAGSGM